MQFKLSLLVLSLIFATSIHAENHTTTPPSESRPFDSGIPLTDLEKEAKERCSLPLERNWTEMGAYLLTNDLQKHSSISSD